MQLKLTNRDTLLKPLQAVTGIVERRHTMPILSNVLIRTANGRLQVTANDMEVEITAETELEGAEGTQAITAGAHKLLDLLRALPADTAVKLDAGDNKMQIASGKSRFNLQTLPAADFPRIQQSDAVGATITLPQRAFRQMLALTEFAMANQDLRFYLNGLLLNVDANQLVTVATDGHRLSYNTMELPEPQPKHEVIVPRKTVLVLSKLLAETDDPVKIEILANQVRFTFGNIVLVSKVIDGKFPDYNRVIPVGYTKLIPINRTLLLSTLQRAAIFANEKFRGVRIVLTNGSLKIVCTNSEQEEAEEELEVGYEGEALDIGFNINYLLDVLNHLSATDVIVGFGDVTSSALFTIPDRTDYKYVVMPMRI